MGSSNDRVVVHLDVDCFYAQSEILRRPWLRDRPVGVTQKFLVVTSNYVARQIGVPKMVPIDEAKRCCSDLVLVNGEDLTPYRSASTSIMSVIRRFGIVEKRGLDECAVDVSEEISRRYESSAIPKSFIGLVVGGDKLQETTKKDVLLMLGTQLAAEIRCAVENETGFQCSCGIAHNKMLAKLACSLNKPNKQTCIPQSAVATFIANLPVRKIPGVGTQTESILKEIGVETMSDLQRLPLSQLSSKFGDRFGKQLFDACRGEDHNCVKDKGLPKSLSVEDSFKPCSSLEQAKEILGQLAPDLIARLDEDRAETERRPKTFTVKWKSRGIWTFTSTSTPMPAELLLNNVPMERRIQLLVDTGLRLLSQRLGGRSFCVLNIGATNFTSSGSQSTSPSADIRSFMASSCKLDLVTGLPPVKVRGEARALNEEATRLRSVDKKPVFPEAPSASKEEDDDDHEEEEEEEINSFKLGIEHEGLLENSLEATSSKSLCSKCGEELPDSRTKQQHMDFHFASELQVLENGGFGINLPNKRSKRNGTLDSFVIRRQ